MKEKDLLHKVIVRGSGVIKNMTDDKVLSNEVKAYVNASVVTILEPAFEYIETLEDSNGIKGLKDTKNVAKVLKNIFKLAQEAGIIRRGEKKEDKDGTKKADSHSK